MTRGTGSDKNHAKGGEEKPRPGEKKGQTDLCVQNKNCLTKREPSHYEKSQKPMGEGGSGGGGQDSDGERTRSPEDR